jgi:hypothetical protein
MLAGAIFLFVIAAIFGLINLSAILRDQPTPKLSVLAHGIFAFIALLVLIAAAISHPESTLLLTSVVLFILAALVGFTLLSFDLRNKPIPKVIAIIHPLVAVSALVLLVIVVFKAV